MDHTFDSDWIFQREKSRSPVALLTAPGLRMGPISVLSQRNADDDPWILLFRFRQQEASSVGHAQPMR